MQVNLKINRKPTRANIQNTAFFETQSAFADKLVNAVIEDSEANNLHINDSNIDIHSNFSDDSDEKINLSQIQEEIQKAYDQGFSDGQETTRATFQAQIQQHQRWLRNLDSVIADLRSQYSRTIVDFEESVVTLAIMISEHIIHNETLINPDIVIEQVKKAIESLDNDIIFKIRINPANIEVLEKVKSRLIKDTALAEQIQLLSDDSIDITGCLLETSAGTIDARLLTQLGKVRKSLETVPIRTYDLVEPNGNSDDINNDSD